MEIYLPASGPDNFKFGKMPANPIVKNNYLFNVKFTKEVWYNKEWRKKTIDQIKPALCKTNILIGFSKSGIGALNIAIENPKIFQSVVVFDAPLMHKKLPPWNTSSFYSQSTWKRDLPENCLTAIKKLSQNTNIIHIGGASFYRDHKKFRDLLKKNDIQNNYLSKPSFSHSWESGWLIEGIKLAGEYHLKHKPGLCI